MRLKKTIAKLVNYLKKTRNYIVISRKLEVYLLPEKSSEKNQMWEMSTFGFLNIRSGIFK